MIWIIPIIVGGSIGCYLDKKEVREPVIYWILGGITGSISGALLINY